MPCEMAPRSSDATNAQNRAVFDTEQVVFRSARARRPTFLSTSELLCDRICGRIRTILDSIHLPAIIIPTVMGKVLIQRIEGTQDYRVKLWWPAQKRRAKHDYRFSATSLRAMDQSSRLIIDGLVSAATRGYLDWQQRKRKPGKAGSDAGEVKLRSIPAPVAR